MAKLIAGTDEVGRGPLAGPVVAAAVVFEEGYSDTNIQDSKKLSNLTRRKLVDVIKKACVSYAIVSVGHQRIRSINIREASKLAMSLAVKRVKADLVLVDGNMPIITSIPQETIIGGDRLRVEISAASILAKVYRDDLMKILDQKYPGYDLATHAGYPTARHRAMIAKLGPSPVHRVEFSGVKEYITPNEFPRKIPELPGQVTAIL